MMNKAIVFSLLVFLIVGTAGAYEYMFGDDEDTLILDIELPNSLTQQISNLATVNRIEVSNGETIIRLDNDPLLRNQRENSIRNLKLIEHQLKTAQSGLVSNVGNLNCRSANDGINVSSSIIFNAQSLRYEEVWTPNPLCNGLANSLSIG